jgi:hypothetical protein
LALILAFLLCEGSSEIGWQMHECEMNVGDGGKEVNFQSGSGVFCQRCPGYMHVHKCTRGNSANRGKRKIS